VTGGRRVVVVGDALLDRDVEGRAERLSPDAPVPVLDEHTRHSRPGGAALVAALVAGDGDPVTLVAPIGRDRAGEELLDLLAASGVDVEPLSHPGATPEKIRLLADGRPLLRLDRGGQPGPEADLPERARTALEGASVVIVADYGRGTAAAAAVRTALASRQRPTLWDPHVRGPAPIPGATLVTPNAGELRATLGQQGGGATGPVGAGTWGLAAVTAATATVRRAWRVDAVATTLGRDGAVLVDGEGPPLVVPAEPATGGDPCGAGDRFVASVASALGHGALVSEAVTEAVGAASRFVGAGGARALRPASLPGPTVAAAVDPAVDAEDLARSVRAAGGTVVVAGGCFDLLHAGHLALLESARRLGDCLIVALNSDASVRRLKGAGRPVVPAPDRAALLGALRCVDAVAVFEEDSPVALLDRLRPHVFAKGADYSAQALPEGRVVAAWGGQAVVLPYRSGRSTTRLLELAGDHP
jgi:rfaE bifunctional protein nucleotidyltransferase chain/domain/rfaE bifunctional protein kinase chain/domain